MPIYYLRYPLYQTSPLHSHSILPHVVAMFHSLGMGEFSLGIKIQIVVFCECVRKVRFYITLLKGQKPAAASQ